MNGQKVSKSDQSVINAFLATNQGFQADRVIADPEINRDFLTRCAESGLPGTAFDWNWRLMNLRKTGHLKGLPRSLRTIVPMEESEFDRYKFACEIAIQRFVKEGDTTLDHVLCDPEMAASFDRFVLTMLPDRPSSFKIRWFAFRIRKRANKVRQDAAKLNKDIQIPTELANPYSLKLSHIPAQPGLYWLSGQDRHLYVGETMNLRERFEVQFGHQKFGFWDTPFEQLKISFRPVSAKLAEHQSRWISKWQPVGNYSDLASKQ
jgi:hypothetical protein